MRIVNLFSLENDSSFLENGKSISQMLTMDNFFTHPVKKNCKDTRKNK